MSVGTEAVAVGGSQRTARESLRALLLRRPAVTLLAMLLVGEVLRIVLAFKTSGDPFDLESYRQVRDGLTGGDPLGVYGVNTDSPWARWPYPAGFFPVILGADGVAGATGRDFVDVLRVFISLGDLLLAVVVWSFLRRTYGEARGLLAAAFVLFAPTMWIVSSDHGQLDVLAWTPAIAALLLWDDARFADRRALYAGALVGLAIALKTPTGLMLLALIPTVRSRKEAVQLAGLAGAIPVLSILPFFLADPQGVRALMNYHGVPGFGGFSLIVQPTFPVDWLQFGNLDPNWFNDKLGAHGGKVTGLAVLGVTALLIRRRTPAPVAALTLVLTIYVLGFNFLLAYGVWALAVLIASDKLKLALWLQAGLLIPTLLRYGSMQFDVKIPTAIVYGLYVPIMIAMLGVWIAWWLSLLVPRGADAVVAPQEPAPVLAK